MKRTRNIRSLENLSRGNNYDFMRRLLGIVFEEISLALQSENEVFVARVFKILSDVFKYDLAPAIVGMLRDITSGLVKGGGNAVEANT